MSSVNKIELSESLRKLVFAGVQSDGFIAIPSAVSMRRNFIEFCTITVEKKGSSIDIVCAHGRLKRQGDIYMGSGWKASVQRKIGNRHQETLNRSPRVETESCVTLKESRLLCGRVESVEWTPGREMWQWMRLHVYVHVYFIDSRWHPHVPDPSTLRDP